VKFLLDEMLSASIAEQLRKRSYDAAAVEESPALRGLADPDLFDQAQRDRQTLVTYNREDFLALDRAYRDQGRNHHGLVILHPRRFPQGAATTGALVASLATFASTGPPYPGFIHWLQ
jgi:Domain of unknown function (DUF5615)